MQGSLFVYERFDKYKPREDGEASFTAGPKVVHFDRVEWHVQPDHATKAAAMQAGEMDWWENPTADLLPLLKEKKLSVRSPITTGTPFLLRPNHLYPPFDKPAVRRALMGAIDQQRVHDRDDGRGHLAVGGAVRLLPAGLTAGERCRHVGADRQARLRRGEEATWSRPATRARRWCSWWAPTSRS